MAAFGIQVVLVQPGDVCTPMTENRVRAHRSGPGSPYLEHFEAALRIIERDERSGVPARDVARRVAALVERGPTRLRYTVGKLAQRAALAAKLLLPSRAFARLVRSLYGLSRR